MSIDLDARTFGRLITAVAPGEPPTPSEIRTILLIAQLAAEIDLDDDEAEVGLLASLTRQLCALGRIPRSSVPVLSQVPTDAEERHAQITALARQLGTQRACELAFVVAYLLVVVDLELAPVEADLLVDLRTAFGLPPERADALAGEIAELVTPGAYIAVGGSAPTATPTP